MVGPCAELCIVVHGMLATGLGVNDRGRQSIAAGHPRTRPARARGDQSNCRLMIPSFCVVTRSASVRLSLTRS